MINEHLHYLVPKELGLEGLRQGLGTGVNLEEDGGPQDFRATFYDSFDWRLFKAGDRLAVVSDGTGERMHLQLSGEPIYCFQANPDVKPRFASDLPDPIHRERLAAVLDMRVLLPRLEVARQVQTLRVLNRDAKTVARLQLETGTCRNPETGERGEIGDRVVLLPARGYRKTAKRLRRHLEQVLELAPAPSDFLPESLEATGQDPWAYSTKLSFAFGPKTPAGMAAREIYLQLLDTLEANVPGARSGVDTEFLHDLRIAVRRTRSALGQIRDVFPPEETQKFRDLFGWIGQVTGPTRDMDVYLLYFPGYRESLPAAERNHLEPLHEFLLEHQRIEQQTLSKRLGSPHFRRIVKEWRAFLETPQADSPAAENAWRPIGELANERILKTYNRVLKEGLAITPESPPEALHELRKSGKKLRYLMEFFSHLYRAKEVNKLVGGVKKLLTTLGSFQDLEVQAGKLREIAGQMTQEGKAPPETLAAIETLAEGLMRNQAEVRREFAGSFSDLAAKKTKKDFRRIFGKTGKRR